MMGRKLSRSNNHMRKSFVLTALLISVLFPSCMPNQEVESIQMPSVTNIIASKYPTNTMQSTSTAAPTSERIYNISISPDGERIAVTRSTDVQVYNLTTGDLIYSSKKETLEGHFLYAYIAWSPDGRFLATGRSSSGINIWDTNTWDLLTEVKDPKENGYQVSGFAWLSDGSQLALGMRDGTTQTWDAQTNVWTPQKNCDTLQVIGITAAASNEFLMFTNAGTYDIHTCKKVRNTEFGMDGCCGYTVLSPDKKNIFVFFDLGGNVRNVENNEYMFGLCCYPAVAWSMDGRYFAAIPRDGNTMTTLDTSDGSSYVFVTGTVEALAWTPENELIAASVKGIQTVIWNVYTGETLATLQE